MKMKKSRKIINWLFRRKRKIALNIGIGGFGLSDKACVRLMELGLPEDKFSRFREDRIKRNQLRDWGNQISPNQIYYGYPNIERDNPRLIQVIEELEHLANGEHATIGIAEIPAWIEWSIDQGETGYECVQERHRTWDAIKTYLQTHQLVSNLATFAEMYDVWMASEEITNERKKETTDEYIGTVKEIERRGLDPLEELKTFLIQVKADKEYHDKLIENALRTFPKPDEPTEIDIDLDDENEEE